MMNEVSLPETADDATLTPEQLARKVQALERLLEISRQVSTLDFRAALTLIMKNILELCRTRRGMLMLRDKRGGLRFEFSVNLEREEVDSEEFEISRSIVARAAETGKVMIVKNVPSSSAKDHPSFIVLGLKAVMAIPLQARDRVVGVIYTDTDVAEHEMTARNLPIFSAFGSQAAIAIENARLHENLQNEYFFLKRSLQGSLQFDQIIYRSQAMHKVVAAIKRVLENDITVLITGETGTGKELVARAIHYNSRRKDKRFLSQNAGALPDSVLESELFGHRRGAFSGAVEHKAGLFEAADGGTVFLDELGEASPALQVRLLRFLETGAFRRVGDTANRSTDVRVIAATHRDLMQESAEGRFRADLYYRLSVFPIHLPALRERREDIPVLVERFVAEFNEKLGKAIRSLPKKVMYALTERDWPGNVRELRNLVHRMMVLAPDEGTMPESIYFEDCAQAGVGMEPPRQAISESPARPAAPETPAEPGRIKTLEEVEREHVRETLARVGGNQAKAARCLGLKRSTFRWRLKKLGLA